MIWKLRRKCIVSKQKLGKRREFIITTRPFSFEMKMLAASWPRTNNRRSPENQYASSLAWFLLKADASTTRNQAPQAPAYFMFLGYWLSRHVAK